MLTVVRYWVIRSFSTTALIVITSDPVIPAPGRRQRRRREGLPRPRPRAGPPRRAAEEPDAWPAGGEAPSRGAVGGDGQRRLEARPRRSPADRDPARRSSGPRKDHGG